MKIEIEEKSGFCFGVVRAIHRAEEILKQEGKLYALGEIVHNNAELERLEQKGLVTLNNNEFKAMKNKKVLIRAHGEPPETYKIAGDNNINLVDATCPVVLDLQCKISRGYEKYKDQNVQIVIFGRKDHPEVKGLVEQVAGKTIVIENENDINVIDYQKPVLLYSQTTRDTDDFHHIAGKIRKQMNEKNKGRQMIFEVYDTICGRVRSRRRELEDFAGEHEVIVFVSGKNSSNGNMLYNICKAANERSYFIADEHQLKPEWIKDVQSVGICGATSTPQWLMYKVKDAITELPSGDFY